MGAIYSRAFVTIVAANGWDANHGLRGIRGVTAPRYLSENGNIEQDLYKPLQPHSSVWYSRAWTFQEMIFSPRLIVFQYQLPFWDCRCATWHEASKATAIIAASRGPTYTLNRWGGKAIFRPWPDVQQYIGMVRECNNRQLTLATDGLYAISGLINVWGRSFYGGFICGLPQMFFDDALLWQPCQPLRRREGTGEITLPSWTWAGWEGEIKSKRWLR